jgi:hypothetical protein
MNHLDCPLCAGPATIDDQLRSVRCDGCGVSVDIAADPAVADLATLLDAAA